MHCISHNNRVILQHNILIIRQFMETQSYRDRMKLTAIIDHEITDIEIILHPKTEDGLVNW